jgi:transcriptional regulator with XRE-family HTH domain
MKKNKFAKDLRRRRKDARTTQEDLARRTGTTGSNISGIENRKWKPGAALFLKLCKVLLLDPRKYWVYVPAGLFFYFS